MSDYPLSGIPGQSIADAAVTAILQGIPAALCQIAPAGVLFAASKIPSPYAIPAYIGGQLIVGSLCQPPPPMPPPIPIPPGHTSSNGQCKGVLYRLHFRLEQFQSTGANCPGIQEDYTYEDDYVDFYGPIPASPQFIGHHYDYPLHVCVPNPNGGFDRIQQGYKPLQLSTTIYFYDGVGLFRLIYATGAGGSSGVTTYTQLYIERLDNNVDNCPGASPQPYPYYLPAPTGGPPGDVQFPVNIPFPGGGISFPINIGGITLSPNFAPQINFQLNFSPVSLILAPSGDIVLRAPNEISPYVPAPNPQPNPSPQPLPPQVPGAPATPIPQCLEDNICLPFSASGTGTRCDGTTKSWSVAAVDGLQGLAKTIEDSTNFLYEVLKECPNPPPPIVANDSLGSGVSTDSDNVQYVDVGIQYLVVQLLITSYDKRSVDIYKMSGEEIEGKFGWVSVSVEKTSDSVNRQYVITRATEIEMPSSVAVTGYKVRVSLRKGCHWSLVGVIKKGV